MPSGSKNVHTLPCKVVSFSLYFYCLALVMYINKGMISPFEEIALIHLLFFTMITLTKAHICLYCARGSLFWSFVRNSRLLMFLTSYMIDMFNAKRRRAEAAEMTKAMYEVHNYRDEFKGKLKMMCASAIYTTYCLKRHGRLWS